MLADVPQPKPDDGRFGNMHWRFNVLYAAAVLILSTLPLWLSVIIPHSVAWVNGAILLCIGTAWVVISVLAVRNFRRLMTEPVASMDGLRASRTRKFQHIVMVGVYTQKTIDIKESKSFHQRLY